MKPIILVLAMVLTALHTSAQSPATGFPMYGSFDSQGIAGVNLQNLNYHMALPVVGLSGRKLSLNLGISHDSSIWTILGGAWTPRTDQSGIPNWGWDFNNVTGRLLYTTSHDHCTGDPHGLNLGATHYYNFALVAPDGTVHAFNVRFQIAGDCGTTSGSTTGYATDNSGYFMDGSVMNVWDRAGTRTGDQVIEDTNGNQEIGTVNPQNFAELDWTDSVGRIGLKVTSAANGTWSYNYLDSSGAYQTVSTDTLSMNIKTNFGCAGIVEYTGVASLPQHVYLPNLQKYTITYESTPGFSGYYTGRIKSIAMPSGGSVQFTYTGSNDGINCADASTNGLQVVTNTAGTLSTKTFARAPSGANWQTTVTNPQLPYDSSSNQTVLTFNSTGQEITRQTYQGNAVSQNLLRTATIAWAANGTPSSKTTVLEDGQTQSKTEVSFDSYGNLLNTTEHDWGTGVAGPVARTTAYVYSTDTNYLTRHILNLATTKTVADGSGVVRSREVFAYDGTALNPCPTGVPAHDDTNDPCSFLYRGNLTSTTTYTNAAASTGPITKNYHYDVFGNLVQADSDCCKLKSWIFSSATNYAYPDSITFGAAGGTQLTMATTYNLPSGTIAKSVDENLNSTSYSYDTMNRLLSITRPDSTVIKYSYGDTGNTVSISSPIQGTNLVQKQTLYDSLGRPIKTSVLDATGASYSITETKYDPLSRAYMVSNPHNSTAQYWTESRFDALGRPTVVIPPDGSATSNNLKYTYAGSATTITDHVGKSIKQQIDGLGRVTKTSEPDVLNGNALTQETDMTYSVLDLLLSVTQGAQSRTNSYDDTGRLISVKSPEANQIPFNYLYNNYNQVTQRTDARGVVTTFSYDNLNRPGQVSYNVGSTGVPATSSVTYTYDENGTAQHALGKLTTMTDGVGTEKYSYNNLEQIKTVTKVISGTTYTTNYTFNLAGELASIVYPSGRTVLQLYDVIGRLCGVGPTGSTCTSANNYAGSFSYSPANEITALSYGNGITSNLTFSPDRLELTNLAYQKGAQSLFNLSYWYKTDSTNCPSASSGNNGQIQCVTDAIDSGRNTSFSYDALGRLSTASTTGSVAYPKWGLSFTYDRYGNRTAQSVTAGTAPGNSVAVSTTTNRIITSGYSYDANGNMTNDGSNSLTYDAENRPVSSSGSLGSATYTYDGNGLRVKKLSGGTTTVYAFSNSKLVATYVNGAAVTSPNEEYVYANRQLIATLTPTTSNYYLVDNLSVRAISDPSGNVLGQQANYPFGEPWYSANATTKWRFTGYERDSESGNDYAKARFNVSRLGRYSSPDILGGTISQPQTLNRYSYSGNDPVNRIDPSGLKNISWFLSALSTGSALAGCSADGLDISCDLARDLVTSGAAIECPPSGCNSIYRATTEGTTMADINTNGALTLNCTGASIGSYECFWASFSLRFVENGATPYLVGDAYGLTVLHLAGNWADSDFKKGAAVMAASAAVSLETAGVVLMELDDIVYSDALWKTDPFHSFPKSMDAEIIDFNVVGKIDGEYVQYDMPGTFELQKGDQTVIYTGTYQIGGVYSNDGSTFVVTHRFFLPNVQ